MRARMVFTAIILLMISAVAEAGADATLYTEATHYLKQENNELAFMTFRQIVRDYPNSEYVDEAQFRIAEYYFNKKIHLDAEKEFNRHLNLYPKSRFKDKTKFYLQKLLIRKLIIEGDAFYKKQKWNKALNTYINVREFDPKNQLLNEKIDKCNQLLAKKLTDEGDVFYGAEKWTEALNLYAEAMKHDPESSLLKERIAKCRQMIEFEKEQSEFEKEQKAKGLVKYRGKWMKSDEKEVLEVERKSAFYFDRGKKDWYGVLSLYTEAVRLNPQSSLLREKLEKCKQKLTDELVNNGDGFCKYEEWYYALTSYAEAIKLNPKLTSINEKISKCKRMIESEDKQRAKGLVKYQGKWVYPESTYRVKYHISLQEVRRPDEAKKRYGPQKIEKVAEETKYYFEDAMVKIVWIPGVAGFDFILNNKTEHSIRILWDEAAFVDENGFSHRVIHSGVKYTDKDRPQPPSVVPGGSNLGDIVIPADHIYWQDIFKPYKWKTKPLFPETKSFPKLPHDPLKEAKEYFGKYAGKTLQILLPLQIVGIINDYIFTFRIDNVVIVKE